LLVEHRADRQAGGRGIEPVLGHQLERYITIICASTKMRIEVRRGARHFVGAGGAAFLAPRAGRGPDAQEENQTSAR
jgi:hypothetical protein